MKLTKLFEQRMHVLIKGKDFGVTYPNLIHSIPELKGLLKEHYRTSKVTIEGIAKLYAEHDYKLVDNILEMEFPVKELDKYKEFKRTSTKGNLSEEDWDKLKADIKKQGIKDYGILSLNKQRGGDVKVTLGEGNHRLAIAKELGIKKMKVRLYFG